MSRRDGERERERTSHTSRTQQQQASARTNEYFVPKEGIDREVITADICRYLGNDALVRPGNYENPQTRQLQQGYFITAYRNLTTAMIADLKADSDRWDAERRQTASRGQPSNVEYRASTTHQSRQYYGPTEAVPAAVGYSATPASSTQPGVYDSGPSYGQQGYAQPSQNGYGAPIQSYAQDNYAYVAGADMAVDPRSNDPRSDPRARQPVQAGTIPRTGPIQQYPASSNPQYQQPVDSRNTYYTPVSTAAGYPSQHPADPYYGRANPSATQQYGDSTPDRDRGEYPVSQYSAPPPISSTSSTTATSGGSSRREHRERDDRDSRGHRTRR